MPDTWLTIEQAAVAMRLSVRTVNRHITGGKIQSRLNDGRREVLVRLPDGDPSATTASASVQPEIAAQRGFQPTDSSPVAPALPTEDRETLQTPATLNPTPSVTVPPSVSQSIATPPSAGESMVHPTIPTSVTAPVVSERSADSTPHPTDSPEAQSSPPSMADPAASVTHASATDAEVDATPVDASREPLEGEEVDEDESSVNGSSGSPVDVETVLTLADHAADKADVAISAYQTLARVADSQARTLRNTARLAWSTVALMTVGITVAVWWTTKRLTYTDAQVEILQRETESLEQQAARSAAEADRNAAALEQAREQAARAREEAANARADQARAEGKAAALTDAANRRPTTRPGLFGRLTSLFGD